MSDELYEDEIVEHLVDVEDEFDVAGELSLDEKKVRRALADLEDDFGRSGAPLALEELDRAAVRHELSIVEIASLVKQAEEAGLIESRRERDAGLDETEAIFAGSYESLDSLQTYLNDIGRFPLLSGPEEVALARAIEAGQRAASVLEGGAGAGERAALQELAERGKAARDRFIASNLRLVFGWAKYRRNQGLDFLDLLQEGTLGVIRAVDKFDYRKGFKFSTYATWWVRQSIDRALADKGRVIRLPVHIVERLRKIVRAERKLSGELGREPTITEVAEVTGFDPADVAFVRDAGREILSLDVPLSADGEGATRLELIPDPAADTESEALRLARDGELLELLAKLPYRERRVLELRYGIGGEPPRTLDEVGQVFNVTRERIRQIENSTLKKLESLAQDSGFMDLEVAA